MSFAMDHFPCPRLVLWFAAASTLTYNGALAVELSPLSPRARAAADAAASAPAVAAAAAPAASQPGRIRLKYREGALAAGSAAAAQDVNVAVEQAGDARVTASVPGPSNTETKVLDRPVSGEELARIAESAARNPNVEWAVPEKIEQAQQAPVDDPLFDQQWHYHKEGVGIRAPQAWKQSTGRDVIVAVVDTGFRPHADLKEHLLSGYDFVSNPTTSNDGDGRDADATDPGDFCASRGQPSSWHGTHVSGTIAAVTNNHLGVAGIAHGAKILPVRVLGQCGGSSFDITDGIRWSAGLNVPNVPANPNPAKVINLSLGGMGECDADYADAFRQARARGVTIVVAAGNSDVDSTGFRPANCEGVISVAATNPEGGRAFFGRIGAGSNFGAKVKIAAPGGETFADLKRGILSTLNDGVQGPGNDSYEAYQGTSMAAPHVAAVVALMYQVHPTMTPDEALSILQSTSQPFPKVTNRQCDTKTCGAGIANAEAAVAEAAKRASQVASASGQGVSASPPATGASPRDSRSQPANVPAR
jgi:serine protease